MGLSLSKVAPGRERYYLEVVASGFEDGGPPGAEPEGRWAGAGSATLGLAGEVTATQVRAVLGGADPGSGELLRRRGPSRVAALDLTFAAPKSASLVFALGSPAVASEVRRGHELAVGAVVGYLERDALMARRSTDAGRWEVPVTGAIAAGFLHRTSRAADPHLHSHVLVANLVQGLDGRWSAIDARALFALARTAGFLYEAQLRHELAGRLGVAWGEVRHGRADVLGVGPQLLRGFSRRGEQVRALVEEWGNASHGARQWAAQRTRPSKDLSVAFELLREGWRERVDACTEGTELDAVLRGAEGRLRARELAGPPRGAEGPAYAPGPGALGNARDVEVCLAERVPAALTRAAPRFSRPDVIRRCCEEVREGATVERIESMADSVLGSPLVVEAAPVPIPRSPKGDGPRDSSGREWSGFGGRTWTTSQVRSLERSIVGSAEQRAAEDVARVDRRLLEEVLATTRDLERGQVEAVRRLVGCHGGVVAVAGRPQWGGLDALDAARRAWQQAGLRVLGTAPSTRDSAELWSATGIESVTAEALLGELDRPGAGLPPSCVLVVTRAEALPLVQLERLLERAQAAGTKAAIVAGLAPLGREQRGDGPIEELRARNGSISLDARSLLDPVTERTAGVGGPVLPSARESLAVGPSTAPGVRFASGLSELREKLLGEWFASRKVGGGTEMVATRRRDVDLLNARARRLLREAGELGESLEVAGRTFSVGDEVLARRRGDPGLPRRTRSRVVGVDGERRSLQLGLDEGRVATVSAERAEACGLSHAYAVGTADRGAGRRALALGNRELLAAAGCRLGATDAVFVVSADTRALERDGAAWRLDARSDESHWDARESLLGQAALASPPRYLAEALGPVPQGLGDRRVWRESAGRVQAYRERWEVTDSSSVLGPDRARHEAGPVQRAERARVERSLDAALRVLQPHLHRALDRARSREGRSTGRAL